MAEVQPPEGLREDLARRLAARYGEAEVFTDCDPCDEWRRDQYRSDAGHALAALFEACEVRERWYVKHLNTEGRSNWARVFNHYAEAVDVEARNRAAAEREGDRSVLLRTVALKWTDPPPPVSSTGEEKTDHV